MSKPRTAAVLHWYTQSPPPLGAVALCGHVKRDTRQYTQGAVCPECEIVKARKPLMTIYLSRHEHDWLETGANLPPAGTWRPVFTCTICGDVCVDLETNAKTWERA